MSIPKASPLPPNPTFADLTSPTWLKSRNKRSRDATFFQTLKTSLIALPTITVLAPLAFLSQTILSNTRSKPTLPDSAPIALSELKPPSQSDRKYDITIVGVTGFTGKLVLEYYIQNYPNLKIAVSGRNLDRVQSAVSKVQEICSSNIEIGILKADAGDWDGNFEVARNTKVVVTTAGPFAKIGDKLITACAHSGTHYADITGETGWVRSNVARLGSIAGESGGVLCSLCGHDSVPWEFSVKGLEEKMGETGEDLVKGLEPSIHSNMSKIIFLAVVLTDEIASQASGGTIATMVDSVENPIANVKSTFDPIYGTKKNGKVINASPKFIAKGPDGWMSFFMMSLVNAEAVKRSVNLNQNLEYVEGERVTFLTGVNNTLSLYMGLCALYIPPLRKFLLSKKIIPNPGSGPSLKQQQNGYLRNLEYVEGERVTFLTGVNNTLSLYMGLCALYIPPLRKFLLSKKIIPNPGSGPSLKQQQNGYLRVIGTGYGSKGTIAKSCIYFDSDPGYRDTARMVAEAGATLLEVGGKKEGGVYTPGAVIREEMTEKLLKGGTAFVVE
ncbi:hypothetical protein TL16_g09085 [Triparma laevis f. inornata]|uniref:Saccharopine dehydrogenase NADP binding domain-containing protein n=1 Tax=Triparma laevis f. inornata TaxID=1714386 RepID=A0A9W7B8R4_9STRA|nr:hypothetical protein TL16_g09085 [Triparma laevis f. inornata]